MNNRLLFLDSIRGIAALIVVLSHIIEMSVDNGINVYFLGDLYHAIDIGRLGVIVFFLLSGFVIPMSLKKRSGGEILNFGLKRFFRLYPVYWFSIIFAAIIGVGFGVEVINVQQVLMNFTMIHKFFGYESVIAAYWTLHLELIFYVLCALLFKLGIYEIRKYSYAFSLVFMVFAILLSLLRYYFGIKVPVVMALGLSCMFLGAYFNYLLSIDNKEGYSKFYILVSVFFIALYISHSYYYQEGWLRWYLSYVASFLVFFSMVTYLKINNKWVCLLGDVSYSLYLLHSVVIGLVFLYFSKYFDKDVAFIYLSLVIIFSSILLSYVTYRLIEVPFQVVGGRITKALRKK